MNIHREGSASAAAPPRVLPTLRKSFQRVHLIIAAMALIAGIVSLVAIALEQPRHGGGERLSSYLWPLLLVLSIALVTSGLVANYLSRRLSSELERWQQHLKQENDVLARQALHDTLTGLPNRAAFIHQLEKKWLDTRDRQRIGVLFIDGNRLKQVNDRYGHTAGDKVLIATAGRLRSRLRQDDLVARLGGDEFAILLSSVEREEQVGQVARDITRAMQKPIVLDEETQIVQSLSIGVSLGKNHPSPQALIDCADSAMYQIKQQGGGWYLSPSHWEQANEVPPEERVACH